MGDTINSAGKIGTFLIVVMTASAAQANCVDPFQLQVDYGSASFTQTRHLKGVRVPLVSRGSAEISSERVDWHVTNPVDVQTVISPVGITQSVENGPPQPIGHYGGGDAFLSSAGLFDLLIGDLQALDAHYQSAPTELTANGAWRLRLSPRSQSLARFVSYLEISGCERVEQVAVHQTNGDWMEITLDSVDR